MRKKTVTPRHAAIRLQIHLDTLRRWIREGKVSPDAVHNIGSARWPRYRIDDAEIDRILEAGTLSHFQPKVPA